LSGVSSSEFLFTTMNNNTFGHLLSIGRHDG
jgi:hypothetical protein